MEVAGRDPGPKWWSRRGKRPDLVCRLLQPLVHCALLLMTVASCAWHGAGQYANAMLHQNERKMRALLPDDDEDGAGGDRAGGGKKKK